MYMNHICNTPILLQGLLKMLNVYVINVSYYEILDCFVLFATTTNLKQLNKKGKFFWFTVWIFKN